MEKTTRRTNTVQTVLSERAVNHFECILHWFWDDFDHDAVTKNLMKMLAVYIKHEPDNVHQFQKADWMTGFIADLISLKDQIRDVQEFERPWEWVEASEGWELPEPHKEEM